MTIKLTKLFFACAAVNTNVIYAVFETILSGVSLITTLLPVIVSMTGVSAGTILAKTYIYAISFPAFNMLIAVINAF
jgi:hypothetical protein